MRIVKKILATIYLVAAVMVIGGFAGVTFGPFTGRFERVLEIPAARIALIVALAVLGIGVLVTVLRTFVARREPDCMRAGGNPDIEVTLAALASIARTAAETEDIMVESVRGKVQGRDRSEVRFVIEAIAFTDTGLEPLAQRIQDKVRMACEEMLGTTGVTVLVRFCPSKTTVVSREVSREQG
ncbi:alkaline shock response membrane anchor protein AmaP [Enorma phocaeensis]|uniref:Alkaline shock response membrane anchor protein AmaP n=1 Tax=Enorma phocaeensis TaxID=1871019 RepID=A0ABT7VB05_9ACTN|nr:alkaline shock response membrane anchor protein AmaP [Enorma phocaeensis]MDM8275680.1 alkaline shock response membrane anchor protein AmaP [Enorma phocaeensis]